MFVKILACFGTRWKVEGSLKVFGTIQWGPWIYNTYQISWPVIVHISCSENWWTVTVMFSNKTFTNKWSLHISLWSCCDCLVGGFFSFRKYSVATTFKDCSCQKHYNSCGKMLDNYTFFVGIVFPCVSFTPCKDCKATGSCLYLPSV